MHQYLACKAWWVIFHSHGACLLRTDIAFLGQFLWFSIPFSFGAYLGELWLVCAVSILISIVLSVEHSTSVINDASYVWFFFSMILTYKVLVTENWLKALLLLYSVSLIIWTSSIWTRNIDAYDRTDPSGAWCPCKLLGPASCASLRLSASLPKSPYFLRREVPLSKHLDDFYKYLFLKQKLTPFFVDTMQFANNTHDVSFSHLRSLK